MALQFTKEAVPGPVAPAQSLLAASIVPPSTLLARSASAVTPAATPAATPAGPSTISASASSVAVAAATAAAAAGSGSDHSPSHSGAVKSSSRAGHVDTAAPAAGSGTSPSLQHGGMHAGLPPVLSAVGRTASTTGGALPNRGAASPVTSPAASSGIGAALAAGSSALSRAASTSSATSGTHIGSAGTSGGSSSLGAASSLAAGGSGSAGSSSVGLSVGAGVVTSGGKRVVQHYSAAQVIATVVNSCLADGFQLPVPLSGDVSRYDLRIADDDGSVDADFPPVDGAALITTIGVDKFVLCETATDRPVLRLVIPATSVQLHVCEADSNPELSITCYPPISTTRAIGFVSNVPKPGAPAPAPPTADAAASAAQASSMSALSSSLAASSISSQLPKKDGVRSFVVKLA